MSKCSTCEVQKDKSAYWTPLLYYQHGNGTFEEVPNDGMTVYYVGRGGNSSNTVPFPEGFKMISGDSLLRHYDNVTLTYENTRPVADRVSFRCINEANDIPETHYINDTNCVNGLRAQLNFQSCWDGVNLYLPDQSHVAYLSGIDYGECPPTHPVPIPGLFYEVLYWSNQVDQNDGGQFVFSNGDPTGYGFHGDFINGWDMDVHTQAVQQCLYQDADGTVSTCAPLLASDDVNFPRDCLESPEAIPEPITGLLPYDHLPGCNPVTPGPANAPQVVCYPNTTIPVLNGTVPTYNTTNATGMVTATSSGIYLNATATGATITSLSASSVATITDSIFGVTETKTITAYQTIYTDEPGVFATGASGFGSTTSSALPTIPSGDQVVTIGESGYTTIAVVLPSGLNPLTSFSDQAEATDYIQSLESLALAEASATSTTADVSSLTLAVALVTATSMPSSPPSSFTTFVLKGREIVW